MKDNEQYRPIEPNALYTLKSLAKALNRAERWVKANMIDNNACRHFQQGKLILVMGEWVIEWIHYDHNEPDRDDK